MAASPVTASEVRAWGREQNANGATFSGVAEGTKGRLNPDLIKAFNRGRKPNRRYVEGNVAAKTVTVEVPGSKGRTRKVAVNLKETRAAALAAGLNVGTRGRLPQDILLAAANGSL